MAQNEHYKPVGFSESIALLNLIENITLKNHKTLRANLSEIFGIDIWRVVNVYLMLYRLPPLLEKNSGGGKCSLLRRMRVLHGIANFLIKCRKLELCDIRVDSNARSILVLRTHEPFYATVLKPVCDYLKKNGYSVFEIHYSKKSKKRFFTSLGDIKQKSILLKRMLSVYLSIDFDQLYSDRKATNSYCVVRELKYELLWILLSEIPRVAFSTSDLKNRFKIVRYDLILSADSSDQINRAINVIGNELKIKSLVIQQGITTPVYPDWFDFTGSYIAAMSVPMADLIVSQGVEHSSVRVTGHPGFDYLAHLYNQPKTQRSDKTTEKAPYVILFASQPFIVNAFSSPAVRDEMIKICLNGTKDVENVRLIYKPHPVENIGDARRLLKSYSHVTLADKDHSISDLILNCDIFITMFSQTTIEAICANKPVININIPESGCPNCFSDSGATYVAKNQYELNALVERLANNNWHPTYEMLNARELLIEKIIYKRDGNSSKRVFDYINNIFE